MAKLRAWWAVGATVLVFFFYLPKFWRWSNTPTQLIPIRAVGFEKTAAHEPWEVRVNLTKEPISAEGNRRKQKLVYDRIDEKPSKKVRPSYPICEYSGELEKQIADALGFHHLSPSVVNGVEKFLFFIGYPRSGHSMIGSVLDAHPNVIIAHEYRFFEKCVTEFSNNAAITIFHNKTTLFNDLYRNSFLSSKCGWRSAMNTSKGYNLALPAQWQGKFSHLRVIGDKSGGGTSSALQYESGKECLRKINEIGVPVVAIHVVRNPYDMIATSVLYQLANVTHTKASDILQRKLYPDLGVVLNVINMCFERAHIVEEFSKHIPVIEIHIEDYIRDPKGSIQQMCKVLGLPCPQDYIHECQGKAYKTVSRSRDLIEWTDSPVSLISMVRKNIARFSFFHGYTFEDDFRLTDRNV